MTTPVSTLQQFYKTSLGEWVRVTLGKKIVALLSPRRQERILGVGYPIPYMPFLRSGLENVPVFMFRPENVQSWPSFTKNRVILGCEDAFPFADGQFDKVLVVHGIELSREPTKLLREIWRILKPEGELLLIAPSPYHPFMCPKENPWGQKGFSFAQLIDLLHKTFFVELEKHKALFFPLPQSSALLFCAPFWEKIGEMGLWPFAGVGIIRAQKQVYQMAFPPEKAVCNAHVILVEGEN